MTLPDLDTATRAGLAHLLPDLSDAPVQLDDPNRLYDAVVRTITTLATRGPVAVLLDDLHWLDEPSAALLHFAIRHLADTDVSLLATARRAELHDNPAVTRVLQALRRDDTLVEVPVGPLAATTIAELTEPIAPGADAPRIAEATGGNPLFALEMARAVARGDEPLTSRVDALIGDRLARLDDRAAAIVPWIAAFGRGVPPTVLARLTERQPSELFEALGELERHGVAQADDDGSVDFVHDLVRSAAYRRLSTPRRTMLHARIGVVLGATADPDDSLAADTARHADLGGDSATCAAACVRAARRCLRLVAYQDAGEHVGRGRRHARRLAPERRVPLELKLIQVLLHPGMRLHDPGELARDLSELCSEAQRLGLDAELSAGLQLLGRAYHWGWGDIPRARVLLQRAVEIMETTSGTNANIEPLLEGARCLAYLEVDMERTYHVFEQLGTLHDLAEASYQYQWGLGLVRAWAGEHDQARAALGHAIELATGSGDHWASFECIARLTLLELETGQHEAAAPRCEQLVLLAAKLGEGSERRYAQAITALHALARRQPDAGKRLDDALSELERIDAHFLTPDLLGIAAEIERRAGNPEAAAARARRALRVATEVARPLEEARACAVLACVAAANGAFEEATSYLDARESDLGKLPGHVRALRKEAEHLIQASPAKQGGNQWQ